MWFCTESVLRTYSTHTTARMRIDDLDGGIMVSNQTLAGEIEVDLPVDPGQGLPAETTVVCEQAPEQEGADSTCPVSGGSVEEAKPIPRPWRHPVQFTGWLIQGTFGLASLIFFLALIAAVPVVNILALGYLLDAEGRVARTGKISHGFPLFPQAKRLGGIMLGVMFFLLPLKYLGSFTSDARIIDPDSTSTQVFELVTLFAAMVVFVHLLFALGRGGSLSSFFRPIKNIRWMIGQLRSRNYLVQASASVREFVSSLRVVENFKLGFMGVLGVLMWTFIPTLLFAFADSTEGFPVIVTLIGGFLLMLVATWIPVLQAGYASQGKFSAYRQLKQARLLFRRTPMLWTFALLLGYALSLVLYLFKIVAPPQDGLWMMTIVFITMIYPARIFIAWVYARAKKIESQPNFLWRWLWSLTTVALCGFYIFLLFFARDIGANGKLVLYEQPLLMIPSPF